MVSSHNRFEQPQLSFSHSNSLPTGWQDAIFLCVQDPELTRLAQQICHNLSDRNYQLLKQYPRDLQDVILDFITLADKAGINCLNYPEKRVIPDLIGKVADIANKKNTFESVISEMAIQNSTLQLSLEEEQPKQVQALKHETSTKATSILNLFRLSPTRLKKATGIIEAWTNAIYQFDLANRNEGDAYGRTWEASPVEHQSYRQQLTNLGLDEASTQYIFDQIVNKHNNYPLKAYTEYLAHQIQSLAA